MCPEQKCVIEENFESRDFHQSPGGEYISSNDSSLKSSVTFSLFLLTDPSKRNRAVKGHFHLCADGLVLVMFCLS